MTLLRFKNIKLQSYKPGKSLLAGNKNIINTFNMSREYRCKNDLQYVYSDVKHQLSSA